MYKLAYILENIDKFSWSDALFLPEDEVWDEDTKGLVLDPDDVESDDEELPKEAKERNLFYALGIQIIQSIVKNAVMQKSNISTDELVEAFLYFYDNDAYIDFGNKK